jgi:hypothetical protein
MKSRNERFTPLTSIIDHAMMLMQSTIAKRDRNAGAIRPTRKGHTMAQTLTPKEIAAEWAVSPKTLRKFLRKDEKLGVKAPGKGGRWEITRRDMQGLKSRFAAWQAKQAEEAEARKALAAAEAPETTDEVEVLDEVESPEGDEDAQ